ncbi:MAG TPA: SurA N-terminal domain-containing protein [Verrucomicrobiales bacterium]|nr:SurA N-terminal domain-containing protein [Verrucomicrobiales bacterium]
MLETFRKHHYILMLLIAIVVVISFTFLSNPTDRSRGGAGSTQRMFTLYNADVSVGEVQSIRQQMQIAGALMQLSQDREGTDPVSQFMQGMGSLVNSANPTNREDLDIDYPMNILVLRHECEKLGIDVEREDLEKFIREIGAFKSNGGFDATKLENFLKPGPGGDRASTETKLFTALRDVMLFQRYTQLIGGSFRPSKAEVDANYAESHQRITASTVLISKKVFENQTITDEDIQKFYDGEKTKQEAADKAAKEAEEKAKQDANKPQDSITPPPPPVPGADPLVLSEEKRTVKHVFTEAPKPPTPPVAPKPPVAPVQEDLSKLPEDQKKAKEEEFKKKQEDHKKAEEEYKKKQEEHQKAETEYTAKMKEFTDSKTAWLKSVQDLSDALNAEERGAKTFEDVAKELKFEVKTVTFTKASVPEELKKINLRGGSAADTIFQAPKGGHEELLGDESQTAYCFFVVTEIEKAALLPMDQVKQKISDKLKAEKVTAALKAAGESARSNILETLKAGKPFKEAVESARAKMLEALKKEKDFKETDAPIAMVSADLPAFSKSKPLPPGTANSGTVSSEAAKLNPGELSPAESVPDGLLLVYVDKKELPKHPDMEQQKKALAEGHTYHNAAATLGAFDQKNFQEYIEKSQFFQERGGFTNPVLKAWFTEARKNAETVTE